MSEKEGSQANKLELQSLQLIGAFLGLFGVIMIVAVIFPEDLEGKITNLVAGVVLLACGIGSFLKGRAQGSKKKTE